MKIKTFLQNSFQDKNVAKLTLALGILLVALLIFQAGIFFGARRESFACNFDRAFFGRGDAQRSILAPFRKFDPNPHGVVGNIVSVRLPSIMVKGDRSTDEEIVTITPQTVIRRFRDNASTTDLVPGNQIIVIGEAGQDGTIKASLIRIMPSPSEMMFPPSSNIQY